jgi:maleate cis-trans isomerase
MNPTIRHVGLLIPASNTTIEVEYNRVLPKHYQVHVGRLLMRTVDRAGWQTQDAEIDHQARLLGTAPIELIVLAQSTASFYATGYDETVTARMQAASGVPALAAGQVVGQAVRALGARRVALFGPYGGETAALSRAYFEDRHGLTVVAAESFANLPNREISSLGIDDASAAMARADQPDIDALVIVGGNFAAMGAIATWERRFNKPIVTSNQATMWAIFRALDPTARLPGYGRLLEDLPGG